MKKLILALLFILVGSCSLGPVYAGNANLSWTNPTHNTDETLVDDLAGTALYRGFENITGDNYDEVREPSGLNIVPGEQGFYNWTGLAEGEHFFRAKTFDFNDNYSAYSNGAKKNIVTTPKAATSLTAD